MRVVTCPETVFDTDTGYKIFMAGGITGCPDWQTDMIELTKKRFPEDEELILINPRRADFDTSLDESSLYQIKWEYHHLKMADETLVWFPKEGRCMITLFELGWLLGDRRVITPGCHPEYVRRFDVVQQVKLRRPDLQIYETVHELSGSISG